MLNATNATYRHFRLWNCTRRIAVSVLCGIDAEHPLTVEVVGGTTIPLFTLSGCKGNGEVPTFTDVAFVVSGVVMAMLPGNQLIGASTSFAMENVLTPVVFYSPASFLYRVSIIVENSQLQWISTSTSSWHFGNTLLVGFTTDDISNVSVIINNSSMFVWSNTSLVSLVAVASPLGSNLSVTMTKQSELSVVHRPVALLNSNAALVSFVCESSCVCFRVTLLDSIVVLDSTSTSIMFIEVTSAFNALVTNIVITVEDATFTLQAQILCFVFSANYVLQRRVNVSIRRAQLQGILDMSNLSTLLITTKNPSLSFVRLVSSTVDALTILMESLLLTATKNLSHNVQTLLSTSTTLKFSSGGTIGFLLLGDTFVSNAAISIENSQAHTQEKESHVLGRNGELPVAVPVGILGIFNFIVHFSGASVSNITIGMRNCTVSSKGEDGATTSVACAPSVLSGLLLMGSGVLGMFSTFVNLSVAVTDCNVTATGNIPTAPSAISVWNTVGIFLHSAIGSFVITDIPEASALLTAAQSGVQMNHSSVVVERCTTTRTSLFSDFSAAGKLRLSASLFSASSIFNMSVTISDSTLNVDNGVIINGAASPLLFVPTSTIVNFTARLVRVNASKSSALMIVGGVVTLQRTMLAVSRSRIGGGGSTSTVPWDAVSVPPTRTGYQTTLSLSNMTLYLSDNSFESLRSVFGNASHRVKSTGTTNSNNVVYTDGPLRIVVPSCVSNTWDGEPLMYTDTIRTVDGQSFPNWSLVTMTTEGGETWCTQKAQQHTTVSSRLNDTGAPTALSASATASRVSTVVATTIVFSVLSSNSLSTGGASSSFPRLQGLVGILRLSTRCTQSLSGDDDDNSDSSINHPVNDISDNPLLLQLPSSVAQPSISYATGALLGNSALVFVVSVASHVFYKILRHLEAKAVKRRKAAVILPEAKGAQAHHASNFVDGVYTICLLFLPATPLPASLLLFQGLLLEPTVNAAVVSVASGDRGVTSIILGLVVGVGWITLPCVFLWLLCIRHAPLPVATVVVRQVPTARLRLERIGVRLSGFALIKRNGLRPVVVEWQEKLRRM